MLDKLIALFARLALWVANAILECLLALAPMPI